MKNISCILIFGLICKLTFAQIVINELDCDTPGIDTQEFVELKSDTPSFSLDGYVLVFFNGSASGADSSYLAIDLDGYTTDINGVFLIGGSNVSPSPQLVISDNTIQNGADAIAIYLGNDSDFPDDTLATTTNLIDALVYDTADSNDADLMALLGVIEQINEGSTNNPNSIQRNNDGTYFVGTPTPRQLNDGSGIVLNGISISILQTQYNEGDVFDIVLTTEQNVTSDLNLNITLTNGTFITSDYTGNTSLTIPNGSNTTNTTITLVDDTGDEGDEVMIIGLPTLPPTFLELNDNVSVRIVDNDFVVAPFGVPTNPTYGVVASTQTTGYYNSLNGLSSAALEQAMQDIVANPSIVRAQTYADIIDILKEADQNPANSNQVWLVYTEQGRAKLDFQTTSNNIETWNREHTFPRSRGGFNKIDEDDIADGVDVFWTTTADSLRQAYSEAHALRAADGPENTSRSNQHYGQYNGPTGTLGSFKGDVARSVFFMQIRYNGLDVVNGFPSTVGQLGDLTTLLDWHRNDPPDDFEMNRNNVVYTWQFNRNPFIDHPDLVEYIWGDKMGDTWILNIDEVTATRIKIFPNPANDKLTIEGISGHTVLEIFSIQGKHLLSQDIENATSVDIDLPNGLYITKITSEGKSIFRKIVVR